MSTFDEILASASTTTVNAATTKKDLAPVVAKDPGDEESIPPKTLAIGDFGTGKTEFLLGPLLAGERIWVVETDNGSSLATVRAMIDPRYGNPRCLNRPELWKNIYPVTIPTYGHFMAFLRDPGPFFPKLAEFDPTVSVWEGFSNFQSNYVDMEILKDENADPTEADLDSENKFEYYRKMKRATIRALDRFLVLPGPRGPLPKIVTVLRNTEQRTEITGTKTRKVDRTDALTGEKRPAALIQGAAEALLMPAFDVVFATEKDVPVSSDPTDNTVYPAVYQYRIVKNRYGNLPDVLPADPLGVWKKLCGK